jgi:hypothetical protein
MAKYNVGDLMQGRSGTIYQITAVPRDGSGGSYTIHPLIVFGNNHQTTTARFLGGWKRVWDHKRQRVPPGALRRDQ